MKLKQVGDKGKRRQEPEGESRREEEKKTIGEGDKRESGWVRQKEGEREERKR